MSIPFKGRLFCQNPMYNCGVIGVESWTISHTFAVIFAAAAPHPRWRQKPCNGLFFCINPFLFCCHVSCIETSYENSLQKYKHTKQKIQLLKGERKKEDVQEGNLKQEWVVLCEVPTP